MIIRKVRSDQKKYFDRDQGCRFVHHNVRWCTNFQIKKFVLKHSIQNSHRLSQTCFG